MPPQTIHRYPHQTLKEVCSSVTTFDAQLASLIRDLVDTMRTGPGSVGVAAPQIGVPLRVCVVDVSASRPGKNSNHGLLVMVNPDILKREGAAVMREGCMSVPDYTGDVERATDITVRFQDETGGFHVIETSGFEAVAIQHEADHLDGMLFLDRINSLKTGLFRRKKYK
jgi:peptide deformylase